MSLRTEITFVMLLALMCVGCAQVQASEGDTDYTMGTIEGRVVSEAGYPIPALLCCVAPSGRVDASTHVDMRNGVFSVEIRADTDYLLLVRGVKRDQGIGRLRARAGDRDVVVTVPNKKSPSYDRIPLNQKDPEERSAAYRRSNELARKATALFLTELAGVVRDAATGLPVAGAVVAPAPSQDGESELVVLGYGPAIMSRAIPGSVDGIVLTDESGTFRVTAHPSTALYLWVTSPDHATRLVGPFDIAVGSRHHDIEVVLDAGVAIEGRVTTADGVLVENAVVLYVDTHELLTPQALVLNYLKAIHRHVEKFARVLQQSGDPTSELLSKLRDELPTPTRVAITDARGVFRVTNVAERSVPAYILVSHGDLGNGRSVVSVESKGVAALELVVSRDKDDLEESIEQATRMIERDPGRARAWSVRGVARLVKGDRDSALVDLLEAVKLGDDRMYTRLIIIGLGGETSGLERFAKRDGWMAQLAQFGLGQLSAAELLTKAKASTTAATQMVCQAHGYIGLFAERDGDTISAEKHYQACFEAGGEYFTESRWAKRHLDALRKNPR